MGGGGGGGGGRRKRRGGREEGGRRKGGREEEGREGRRGEGMREGGGVFCKDLSQIVHLWWGMDIKWNRGRACEVIGRQFLHISAYHIYLNKHMIQSSARNSILRIYR